MTITQVAPRCGTGGRPVQALLAIAALAGSVVGTAVLVATPASPRQARPATTPAVRPLPGTRVEVRGGEAFRAYQVADRLEGSGGRVMSVSPALDGRAVEAGTVVVYYERSSMEAARRVRDMLGRGTLRRQQVFEPAVDVTVVLGKDVAHQ